jgi:hypothetical protein
MSGPPKESRMPTSAATQGGPASRAIRVHAKAFRPRIERSLQLHVAKILTDRDRTICHQLYDHHVLTTTQICELHFNTVRVARKRLLKLYRARVLDRFPPHRPRWGSRPLHYILDDIGMRIVATDRGLEPKRIRHRLERDRDLASSSRLDHLVDTNDFFVKLTKGCRSSGDHRVVQWWSEQRSAATWKGALDAPLVRPDGQGTLGGPDGYCSFVLELDRGTERGERLSSKLDQYRLITGHADTPDVLLFLFPSFNREVNARRSLDVPIGMQVATSYRELFEADPLGEVWLPVDVENAGNNRRWRLMHLARDVRDELTASAAGLHPLDPPMQLHIMRRPQ